MAARKAELERELADPETYQDPTRAAELSRDHAEVASQLEIQEALWMELAEEGSGGPLITWWRRSSSHRRKSRNQGWSAGFPPSWGASHPFSFFLHAGPAAGGDSFCWEVADMASKRTYRTAWLRMSLLTVALLVALAGQVGAATVSGATGLIYVPTADTLGEREAEIGVRYVDGRLSSSFMYGVLDQVEVGVNNIRSNGDPSQLGFVLKGNVFTETVERPALAVGFETDRSYVVASKRLTPRLRGHAGFGQGKLNGAFAGASLVLNTTSGGRVTPTTTLLAEYTPRGLNAGMRLVFSPLISVDLSLIDLDELSFGVALRTRF